MGIVVLQYSTILAVMLISSLFGIYLGLMSILVLQKKISHNYQGSHESEESTNTMNQHSTSTCSITGISTVKNPDSISGDVIREKMKKQDTHYCFLFRKKA